MELRSLRAFVEVVRSGGFTAAADRLALTQSAVSKLIGQLESRLGHKLLHRNRRTVSLTESGKLVLQYAESLLTNASNIESALAELAGLHKGELRIGVPPLGAPLFVQHIGTFKRRHPGIELKLFEDGSHAVESALMNGELELGSLLAPVDETRFEHRMLIDDRLALVAPARSHWATRPKVRLEELADEPFILFPPTYAINERIVEACKQCGFTPDLVGRSGQPSFIFEMVRRGLGITLLPSSQVDGLSRRDFSVSALVAPAIQWRIDLAWQRGAYLSAAARAWLDMLRSQRGS